MKTRKMKKITLKNEFHGSETTVLVPAYISSAMEAWFYLQDEYADGDRRRYRRIEKALCGYDGCTCGVVR